MFKYVNLDGRKIAYTEETQFLVQIGKNKCAYKTKYRIKENIFLAVGLYNCINIGNGYKKRIIAPSFNKPLLCRQFS